MWPCSVLHVFITLKSYDDPKFEDNLKNKGGTKKEMKSTPKMKATLQKEGSENFLYISISDDRKPSEYQDKTWLKSSEYDQTIIGIYSN